MFYIVLYRLIATVALMVRAEKIFVTKNESVSPCLGCLKSNSFLDALDRAFHGKENYDIFLEDKSFHIDLEAIKLFLEGRAIQSLQFTEGLTDEERDIILKGRNLFLRLSFMSSLSP